MTTPLMMARKAMRAAIRGGTLQISASNAVNSGWSAALSLLILSTSGSNSLGWLAFALTPLSLSLGVQRAALMQLYLPNGEGWRGPSTQVSAVLGFICMALTVLLIGTRTTPPLWLWVVPLVALLTHLADLNRYVAFQTSRGNSAVGGDLIALGFLVVGGLMATHYASHSEGILLGALCGGLVSLSAIARGLRNRALPRLDSNVRKTRTKSIVGAMVEVGAVLGAGTLLPFGLGLLGDLGMLAEMRLAQMLLAPIGIIGASLQTSALNRRRSTVHWGVYALLIVLVGLLSIGALAAGGMLRKRGIEPTSFGGTIAVLGLATVLSVGNWIRLGSRRRALNFRRLFASRVLMALLEPAIGLFSAQYVGSEGAALGILAHQVVLRVWLGGAGNSAIRDMDAAGTAVAVSGDSRVPNR